MEKYLGIDGGGSNTTAILSDASGKDVRTCKKGAGSLFGLGEGGFRQLMADIIGELLKDEPMDSIKSSSLSFAGLGRINEKDKVQEIVSSLGLNNFKIYTDAEMLHYAAFEEEDGILLAAGTGSVCLLNVDGHLKQFGGWGYLLGDDGSGYYIGREAIRALLKGKEDALSNSTYSEKLLEYYAVNDPQEIISKANSADSPQQYIASCSEVVSLLAFEGNDEALRILKDAADKLFGLVSNAIDSKSKKESYKLATAGSVLSEGSPVHDLFVQKISDSEINIDMIKIQFLPAAAGLLRAIINLGEDAGASLYDKMKSIKF